MHSMNHWIKSKGALLLFAVLLLPSFAQAADLDSATPPDPPEAKAPQSIPAAKDTSLYDPRRTEVRFGGFAHSEGSTEQRLTPDLNIAVVFPRLLPEATGWMGLLIPRAYIGGMVNLEGRTSSLRGGGLWSYSYTDRLFGEIYFGGAIHNGSIYGSPTLNALGSRELFNVGTSLGYRFDSHWSILASFDHLSNGNSLFGLPFVRNQGINSYGLQAAYGF
jgi:lipid A 3-O-deacylase